MKRSSRQVDLGAEKAKGGIVDSKKDHAARPPPSGVVGRVRTCAASVGLDGTKAQPDSRARRRGSKIWNGFAAAGWTCRVAVVCMGVA